MTLVHPLWLIFVVLPLAYTLYQWRRTARKAGLLLKMFTMAVIVVALAEPIVTMPETKTGVVVLLDTSASTSDKDLNREASLVSEMSNQVGRNWMRVIPFARRTRE